MNMIQIAGHLGADVETRFTPDGLKVSTIRIATSIRRGGKDETQWWRVTLWGDRYDKMLPYLKKGSALIVVGEFTKAEVYNDREGRQQISLEVRAEFIRFSPFGKGDKAGSESQQSGATQAGEGHTDFNAAPAPAAYGRSQPAARQAAAPQSTEMPEEDLPF